MPNVIFGHRPSLNEVQQPIVLKSDLRRQHMAIIGKSGVGKSTLAMGMIIQDMRSGASLCVLDPHGDTIDDLLQHVPRNRTNDVVFISPADQDYPVGLNILQPREGQPNHLIVSELVSSIRSQFADSWGPQSEFLLSQAAAAVMDHPGGTLLETYRMLTDSAFRARVVKNIKTPMVKMFWTQVFAKWPASFAGTAVAPLVNKLGAFLMNPALLNMVAQSQSTVNLKELMDTGSSIIFVNLATGRAGEAARLFGSLFITQLYLTALARQSQPEDDRKPFYLYVEEAEHFATEALPSMLAQARKYGLNLTLNFQTLDQLGDRTKNAILGNVGTLIAFRVGGDDAEELEKEFRPQFMADFLRRQDNYHAVYRLQGQGLAGLPATTITLPLPEKLGDEADPETLIRISRERYARPRAQVEQELAQRWILTGSGKQKGPR